MKRKIRLTESQLHRVVRESVRCVLKEYDDADNLRQQKKVYDYILNLLSKRGFQEWRQGDGNYYSMIVTDGGKTSAMQLRSFLIKALGCSPYDISTQDKSSLMGNDPRIQITLPAWTHVNIGI